MKLTAAQHAWLAKVADALIPAGNGMPAASATSALGESLEKVLASRPDLEPKLAALLENGVGQNADEFLRELRRSNAGDFGLLAESIAAAYFQDERVRALLKYFGQTPQPINEREEIDPEVLRPLRERGPIYRATSKN